MTLSVNGDVWKFETGDQDWASDDLNNLFSNATNQTKGSLNTFGNRMKIIKYLRTLWDGESWESIRRKAEAEGSTWYVWYMDGLNAHLRNLKRIKGGYKADIILFLDDIQERHNGMEYPDELINKLA